MNEYVDPDGVRYVAQECDLRGCTGCSLSPPFLKACNEAPQCGGDWREDGRDIIWVKAE